MSQPDNDDRRQRSIKLCKLIQDRDIDVEIGFEIRKLLEEGVLIDFQDQNHNKKTAIHLAVEKCDVICVKFLLRFKPDLKVEDGDGKTPVQLAESKGDQNIRNVLQNSTVDAVNESFVEVIDFESLTRQKLEAIKSKPTFKVLKLTNCPSVNKVWRNLNDQDYTTTLNESSHLFFIAIETNETNIQNDHDLMKKVLKVRRPMIVQLSLSSRRNTKIYIKDHLNDFAVVTETPQMTREDFDKATQSENCDFKLLVTALRSNLFGHFTGDLMATKLNNSDDRSEAEDQFARSNALCHRFFKLFDESSPQIDRIVATLSFKGDQSLLALLDLPFEPKEGKLKLSENQQDILSVVDSSGCDLIMMAVEQSNLDAVKLLIRCGCDFNHSDNYDKRASDICWEMKDFDCLAVLIEADSPYPYDFCIDELDESSEAIKRINAMTEATNSLHEHIKQGETEEVKKFIASYPSIKHAYDTSKKCALTVALKSNRVDIYSMLMSEGFEPGVDDEYQSSCSKSRFKNEIRDSHRKYFKEAFDEPHLKRLLKMSRLSFGSKDRAKSSTIIRKMFDELNEIDEVIPILKICSLSDKLRIVFDFNCDSVREMDPTSGSGTLGVVYPYDGFVYVGAKNHKTEFCKVIGTLIHELTHYAMQLTYGNHCRPYKVGDILRTNRFEAITTETKKICDENTSTDSIVTTVFSLYSQEVWHQELIVRVTHLLAHYKTNPKALEAAERNTPELFHFYRDRTLKDVKRESKVLLQEYLIGKINNQAGITRKLENLNIQFKNVAVDLKPSVYVITSKAPKLTLAMLGQFDSDDSHIFVSLEQVAIGNILDKIAKVNATESSTALIADCIEMTQKYQESLRKLLKDIKNIKTIALVMTEAESLKVKENFPKVESETFDHKWAELTESSKVHLLDQNVIFQGVEMKLDELVDPASEAMNFFPLGELVDCKDFKIGSELPQTSHKFYLPRKFINKGEERSTRVAAAANSFEELSRGDAKMGVMIISDESGSGKSMTLFEMAKSLHVAFPDRWILFVDFKRHIEAFKGVKDHKKIESFEDFIARNILKNELKFDRELFLQMFRDGKTFVLFDGFDEVSPNYKDLLLHVLRLFEPASGNQLYITTRPHLEADLEGVLGQFVFKLDEFTKESQKSFLREYWQSVGFKMSQDDFDVLSQRLLEKFSKIATSNVVGLPLLIRMTAEIFEDPTEENLLHKVDSLGIASVFQKFVEKYFLRWTNNENEISRGETVEFQMSGGILEIHHRIALKLIFDDEFVSFEVDERQAEKISRVGLIRYDKTEKTFHFIHQTFAEYFVADFIWFHLNRKNQDPSHDCSRAVEVLIEVSSHFFDFDVIITFLDQALEPTEFNPSEAFCKSVAKCFSEIVRSKNSFYFLEIILQFSQENVSSLLLSVVKHAEMDVLLKVLKSKLFDDEAALHIAAAYESSAVVSTLCDIITNCTDNPKEIYRDECGFGNALLTAATLNRHKEVLATLCENLNSVLTKDEIKIMFQQKDALGQNIIAIASRYNEDDVLLELISLLSNYLSHDEIKSLLRAVNDLNWNFFPRAVLQDTSESLKRKFEVVKTNFTAEEQKIFFYQPATGPNIFHCATLNYHEKVFETIIESTRDVLSIVEIKSMLMEKDSKGSNLLLNVAGYGNFNSLNELNVLLRERLSGDEIRSLLLEVDGKGRNCFRLAANNAELNFQVFCEIIGNLLPVEDQTRLLQESFHDIDIIRVACGNYAMEILPTETIKRLLTKEDQERRNAFQKVANDGDVDTWNKLIFFARARFSVDEMKSFLFGGNDDGQNCLLQALSGEQNKNMIETICETIQTLCLNVEDQKKILQQKDSRNRNLFYRAITKDEEGGKGTFDIIKCKALYVGLSTILSKDEIKEMLKEKDSAGDNILCYVIKNCDYSPGSCDLIALIKEILTYDEIKNLFFDVDSDGNNFFHCAVKTQSSKFVIKSLGKAIKEILSRDDQKKFFGLMNPNVFYLAARRLKNGIFSAVHWCLKDVLTKDEINTLVREKNSKNENVLHSICSNRLEIGDEHFPLRDYLKDIDEKRLRDYLKVVKIVCDPDEVKNFLRSSDDDGRNCLLLAAESQNQIFLKELFRVIQSELSVDEQRDLIQKCDNNEKNIFTFAALNEISEILSLVEQFAREILSEDQIEEMMWTDVETDSSDTDADASSVN